MRNVRTYGVADDGAVVEVATPAGADAQLVDRWPSLGLTRVQRADATPTRHLRICSQRGAVLAEVDGEPAHGGWDRLESELALFAAERLAGLVAVHAAVVARGGRALLVPGASGTGKSTLCVAAAALGVRVLSDEYALVDPATGLVTGWQRPVRVRRRDGSGVDRLNLTVPTPPLPVGAVAAVTHTAADEVAWHDIAASEAVIRLMENTVCARSRPDDALDAALAIARSARNVAGTRGEAIRSIAGLLALLDTATS